MQFFRALLHRAYHDLYLRDRVWPNWKRLERSQWYSRRELDELTEQKLIRLLEHASNSIPYYREFSSRNGIREIKNRSLLSRFPTVDKEFIRQNQPSLCTVNMDDYYYIENSTSGSTGESLFFYQDRNYLSSNTAGQLRGYGWCGVSPFDRQAILWGASFDEPSEESIKGRIRKLSMPLLFLSSYELSDSKLREYVELLKTHKPKLLTSYPSPLVHLANFVADESVKLPSLKAIVISAEQMFDHQRSLFEDVFGVPVFNRYGSREFGIIAHECECHTGLHVSSDRVFVEILDEEGRPCPPGVTGEVVITDLENYVMPFIRYRIGDMAAWSESEDCPCGRGLPLLDRVEGRIFDLIRTSKGNVISGTFWTILTRHVSKDIISFQVVLNEGDSIDLLLQMEGGVKLENDREAELTNQIKRKAPELDIYIKYVDSIPLTRSGKRRFVIDNTSGLS